MSTKRSGIVDIGSNSIRLVIYEQIGLGSHRVIDESKQSARLSDKVQSDGRASELRSLVERSLEEVAWTRSARHLGLPLVGLGGTIRSLCKIHQKRLKYALDTAHNYEMSSSSIDQMMDWLPMLSAEKRKKVEGLSGDRSDIIAAGLINGIAL